MEEKESESTNPKKIERGRFTAILPNKLGEIFFWERMCSPKSPLAPSGSHFGSSCPLSELAIRSVNTPNRFRSHSRSKYLFCFSAWVSYENLVICQGERVRLHCKNASLGLTILSAKYGRTDRGDMFCPYRGAESDEDYYCGENNVDDTFKTLCERRNRCKVKVNSALFGDPCPEKPKKHLYLTLIFKCGKCLIYVYLNGSNATIQLM